MSPAQNCRLCHAPLHSRVLDLGDQPPSDLFPKGGKPSDDPVAPLELWLCEQCFLVQLGAVAYREETPLAVESTTMRRHAFSAVEEVLTRCPLPGKAKVAEVASHHGGSWLPALEAAGVAGKPLERGEQAIDLLLDVHALAHLDDTAATLTARAGALAPHGWVVLEFHHLLPLVREGQFDAVRHGHPVYLSLLTIQPALRRVGLATIDVTVSAAFGGSLRVYAQRDGVSLDSVGALLDEERAFGLADADKLSGLQLRARRSAEALTAHLTAARAAGRRIAGYGAPSKAAVLLRTASVTRELLPFTADLSPAKQGRRLPGTDIPIVSPENLLDFRPDDVVILTWDIAAEVVHQLRAVKDWGGRFTVPIPELTEVG